MTVALHPTIQLPFPYPTEYQRRTDNRRPPQRPLGDYAPLKHIKREVGRMIRAVRNMTAQESSNQPKNKSVPIL